MNLMRWFHTIRHLRGRQLAGQVRYRAQKSLENPAKILNREVPPYPGCAWRPLKEFLPPLQHQNAAAVQSARMEFLNQSIEIGWPPDWNRTDLPRLWLYNVQYFDYLWVLDFDQAAALVRDWIERHPPACGQTGWEPYPTSLRLMNWCALLFGQFRTRTEQDTAFRDKLWTSVYRQAQWLSTHVETHLMGNHLLENAAALSAVGSCFAGDDAKKWRTHGIALLREQLTEQMLADGGHFERSPMYHSRAVYLLLLLGNLGCDDIGPLIRARQSAAMDAMKQMCHPDGQIALLNDSATGIYNEPAELAAYASDEKPPTVGSFALQQTGYYGARTTDGSYVICDSGPIGPDYQPGHAHGDMLSFEMSLRGHRVIVDSGVFDYVAGEMRDYCRSTRAHNTVEIDGQDQCEFWSVFRVARRGRVHDVAWSPLEDGFELGAAHDGYARLDGRPIHRRTFRWSNTGGLIVNDQIISSSRHQAIARLHLHPDCRVVERTKNSARVEYGRGAFSVRFDGDGVLETEDSFYCPQFGQKLKNVSLAWRVAVCGRAEWRFTIAQMNG